MPILTQKKILNVIPGTSAQLTVHCSQSDTGSRVEFELYAGSEPFAPDGAASLQGIRKDGTGFGPVAVQLLGNVATITLTDTMTGVAGPAICELTLTNGGTVSTANFALLVEPAAFPNGPLVDESVDVYQQILAYVQSFGAAAAVDASAKVAAEAVLRAAADTALANQIAALKGAVGSPLVAATAADMTDKDKVYVYTGSEVGYTAGNWYYWDGSDWVSGGVYNAVAISTDKTLSVADMAADAAVTGGALSALGTQPISYTDGKRMAIVDDEIDIANPVSDGSWRCAAVVANENDAFVVSGTGATGPRAWAFIDSTGAVLQRSAVDAVVSGKLLVAPPESSYLVLNDANTGTRSYKVGQFADFSRKVADLEGQTVASGSVNLWDEQWIVGELDNTYGLPVDSLTCLISKNYCACKPGLIVYVHSTDTIKLYYYGKDRVFLSAETVSLPQTITIPAGAYYFKLRYNSTYGLTYKGDTSINYPGTIVDYCPADVFAVRDMLYSFLVNESDDISITKLPGIAINSSTQKVFANASGSSLFFPVKPNTTYAISKLVDARFVVGEASVIPSAGVTLSGTVSTPSARCITFTTSASAAYICVFYYLSTACTNTEATLFNSIFVSQVQDVVTVEKGGKYNTIQKGIDSVFANGTVIIMPGVYEEQIDTRSKNVNLIGNNKNTCILLDESGNYSTPPLEISGGSVQNLTILETGADSTAESGTNAYCIHTDFDGEVDNSLLISNCVLRCNKRAAFGCGVRNGFELTIENCDIWSGVQVDTDNDPRGALYIHCGAAVETDRASVRLYNNRVFCEDTIAMCLQDNGSTGFVVESIGNCVYSTINGKADTIIYGDNNVPFAWTSRVTNSPKSFGNNVAILNA